MNARTMRWRELVRLVERLRREQSKLDRHARTLGPNDRHNWERHIQAFGDVIDGIASTIEVDEPESGGAA